MGKFKEGDRVKFATGKIEYTVWASDVDGRYTLVTDAGKVKVTTEPERLRLVRTTGLNRAQSQFEAATARVNAVEAGAPSPEARSVAFGEAVKQPSPEKPQETIGAVIRDEVPAHIPGESPAAYKLRTGQKLDGRRTSFGRALLVALQPKLAPIGVKTRRGQGRKANRG